jgi:steroid 5-alpha reductase family enzyme
MAALNIFYVTLIVDFGLQLVFGVLSIILKTEKFYDFIGAITHISCAFLGAFYDWDASKDFTQAKLAQVIQAVCISLWAGKLGAFLFYRVLKAGSDSRFEDAKKKPLVLLIYWMLQGMWVYLNLLPSLFMFFSKQKDTKVLYVSIIGWVLFLFGLVFETVSDYQKTVFRNDPANKGRFITTGLWSISRHPNYFGEIVLWYGILIAAAPFFDTNWAYFAVPCPTLTALQICFLSGIPLLENGGLKRWGNDPEYAKYLSSVSVLVPFFMCCEYYKVPLTAKEVKPEGYHSTDQLDKPAEEVAPADV